MNTIKKQDLTQDLLKRVEFADDKFIGYTGDKYIYILDVLTSQTSGNIINRFWILNEIDDDTFIRIPNNGGGFTFETEQRNGSPFRNIKGENVLVYENGEVVTEEVEVQTGVDEEDNPIYETEIMPVLRLDEFTRNVQGFAPLLGDSIAITVRRYLGEKI